MAFPSKNTGSGVLFPPPGDLPDPWIEPAFPASPALQEFKNLIGFSFVIYLFVIALLESPSV